MTTTSTGDGSSIPTAARTGSIRTSRVAGDGRRRRTTRQNAAVVATHPRLLGAVPHLRWRIGGRPAAHRGAGEGR
jgi:hypothetical protein